ncbi:hornerin-like [Iris pallida]|uniref:Hornerin-like n=1 Tax=Iris pallida TaxID=29817 RepID=A0AAX6H0J2_IRIPA|nr:hornerin-like [Iris pallida]
MLCERNPHDPIVDAPVQQGPLLHHGPCAKLPCEATGRGVRGRNCRARRKKNWSQQECDAVRTSLSSPPGAGRPARDVDPRAASLPMSPSTVQRDPSPHHEMLETSEFPSRARRSDGAAAKLTRFVLPRVEPYGSRGGTIRAACGSPGAAVSAREWYWTR